MYSIWRYAAADNGVGDTNDLALCAAQGAGKHIEVCSLQIVNAHASTATEVMLKSGSTVIWRLRMPAAGTPVQFTFNPPLRCNSNEGLNFQCETASTVFVSAQGTVSP